MPRVGSGDRASPPDVRPQWEAPLCSVRKKKLQLKVVEGIRGTGGNLVGTEEPGEGNEMEAVGASD